MSPREQLEAGCGAFARRDGSTLPAPLLSLRYRIERRRRWWLLGRVREERVEVFRLEEAYVYRGDGFSLHLPKGFEFLASVPRLCWSVISPLDLGAVAAAVHDLLYQCGGRPDFGQVAPWDRTFSREEADLLFLRIMEQEHVESRLREAAYRAVRKYGAPHWRS